MANFIEEFYYGNLDPQARSTKENKSMQKQMEVLMLNMEQYIYDKSNGLWYERDSDYYIPCLKLPEINITFVSSHIFDIV